MELEHSKETITFAPNLYPYFDQGWATSIHKSQGSTFDHVFVWASKWMYQNLTYVALTRHKESVNVYASEEDFHNKQDLISRLSRSQDKDTSLEHISLDQAEALIKQDDRILAPLFEKLEDHLTAIGFVSREAFSRVREKYFTHPDSLIQNSGMMHNHDEQTQTRSATKDAPQFRDDAVYSGRQDSVSKTAKLSQRPIDAYITSRTQELSQEFCEETYGYSQSEPFEKDKLAAHRYVTRRAHIEMHLMKESPETPSSVITQQAKEFYQNSLKEQQTLAQEIATQHPQMKDAHLTAQIIQTHQDITGEHISPMHMNAFLKNWQEQAPTHKDLHQHAVQTLKNLGLSFNDSRREQEFMDAIKTDHNLHKGHALLHTTIDPHKELHHNTKEFEAHVQRCLQHEIQEQHKVLERGIYKGMSL